MSAGLKQGKGRNVFLTVVLGFVTAAFSPSAGASGIYHDGTGTRSMALGGADVAWAEDPLGALGANPAGLSLLKRAELDAGFVAGVPVGRFDNRFENGGRLRRRAEFGPEMALGFRVSSTPLSFAVGAISEAGMGGVWCYQD